MGVFVNFASFSMGVILNVISLNVRVCGLLNLGCALWGARVAFNVGVFASRIYTMGDEMDAPLNGVNAPNWLTHTQLKGNVRHEN